MQSFVCGSQAPLPPFQPQAAAEGLRCGWAAGGSCIGGLGPTKPFDVHI